ncbi:MAG: ABC transporter ATP-binding protein [Nitrospirae bacterium]|nr:MAG: ABC transporter ATP-binding protein [Nitrospirota bacterium]
MDGGHAAAGEKTRMTLIELSHISLTYPNAAAPALSDLTLAVEEGAALSILGPSGCGKTTVLRAIAGFERPQAGAITIAGQPVCDAANWVVPEERGVGMVFQDYALFPHLTVAENVAFGLQRLEKTAAARTVAQTLDLVGLAGFQMREEVEEILRLTGTTAVLVTHDHDEAFAMADRVAVLNHGRLEQVDTPEAIYHTPSTPFVANFVGQADFLLGRVDNGKIHTEVGIFENVGGHQPGAAVEIMIRPDDVHIVPASPGSARIVGRQFRGSENLYTVILPSGQHLHSSEGSTTVYPIGSSVDLKIVATHIVTFPKS